MDEYATSIMKYDMIRRIEYSYVMHTHEIWPTVHIIVSYVTYVLCIILCIVSVHTDMYTK